MKKKELTFIISIVVFALVLWGGMYLVRQGHSGSIRITVDGEEYGTYSLSKDQVISIGDTNVCEIKNGEVKIVLFAQDDPDEKLLAHHISKTLIPFLENPASSVVKPTFLPAGICQNKKGTIAFLSQE